MLCFFNISIEFFISPRILLITILFLLNLSFLGIPHSFFTHSVCYLFNNFKSTYFVFCAQKFYHLKFLGSPVLLLVCLPILANGRWSYVFLILDYKVMFGRALLVKILWLLGWEWVSPKSYYIGFCQMLQVKARTTFHVFLLAWGFLDHKLSKFGPQACLRAELWQLLDFFVLFSPKVWAKTLLRLKPYRRKQRMLPCSWGFGQGYQCGWLRFKMGRERHLYTSLWLPFLCY